ncbi:MAG: iron ABC transporter [Bacillus thermozeamaize]|uniref:Iron ABC transporter n=1 Tax=Bacillus thermozeamaize TaxID=230954 RepID=A0A1Y3PSM9_9BACI|nr:MAG: iron ABC transporter [Bacillus thermozeamaize]
MKRLLNSWTTVSLIGVTVVLLPNLYILFHLFQPPGENWQHVKQYLLKDYILESLGLVVFTGLFTVLIGVTLAWLVAAYDFPLRRFFRWGFVLPLAIPPYIAAYTYSTMLSYTGVVQSTLRNQWGIVLDQKYFDLMSMKGAVFIFTMFLFPYVFLITRTFLERQSASLVENARLLGKNTVQIFFQVVLPVSRAAIVGGLSLVIFEVLNDYGVSSYFGLQTFTTAIFKTWFGMYDVDSAIRLAAWLMSAMIGLLIIERLLRQRQRFAVAGGRTRPLAPKKLRGLPAWAAVFFCLLIFALSFAIPVMQLIVWATWTYADVLNGSFWRIVYQTLSVSFIATIFIMFFAVVVANVCRLRPAWWTHVLARMIAMGYSIPGAVVAIGVLAVFIALDQSLGWLYAWLGWGESKLVLSLSLVMLIVAYVIRFLAIGLHPVEAGFEKVGTKYHEASRLLGLGMTSTFVKVDLPLIRGALLSGFILSFVEIVKELPLTLLLRPFDLETLATKTYQYASDERIMEASIPSLLIIGISMISVWILSIRGEEER